MSYHIITRKRLNEFAGRYPETKAALARWYQTVKRADFASFAELRAVFPSADQVGKLTVFDIGGNKIRLIAAVHYNRRKLYILAVLSHKEYDKNKWSELCRALTLTEPQAHGQPLLAMSSSLTPKMNTTASSPFSTV